MLKLKEQRLARLRERLAAARSSVKSGLPVEESPSSVLRKIRELHKRFDS